MIGKSCPLVAVVVPAHNDWAHTQECLTVLMRVVYSNLDVILVDDGSTDGTAKQAADLFPRVRVLAGDGNLWWTGSMNLGIRDALAHSADYVLALNNDVLVSPDTVKALVDCARTHPGAVVGSLIYEVERPNVIWCAGGELEWPWPGEVMLGCGEQDIGQFNGLRTVNWTPGMGTLMSREVLLKLNLYDSSNMPQYIADADFTLRASRAGHQVLVTSESKIYNHVENTGGIAIDREKITWREFISIFTSLRSADYFRARWIFLWRHCPHRWLLIVLLVRYFRLLGFSIKRLAA